MSTIKRDLIRLLAAKKKPDAAYMVGTIADTGTGVVTVTYFGTDIDGIKYVSSYTPTIGDNVLLSRTSGHLVVIGKV